MLPPIDTAMANVCLDSDQSAARQDSTLAANFVQFLIEPISVQQCRLHRLTAWCHQTQDECPDGYACQRRDGL